MDRAALDALLKRIESTETGAGNPRVKQITNRIVRDLFHTIEDLDVQPAEFWTALNWLAGAGASGELGLLAAGLGFEHLLDVRMDEAEAKAGIEGGTPRTIEGPLYVAGAPESVAFARLDDGKEEGELLFMQGRVLTTDGKPVANALVEVWHANKLGNYSYFDKTQSPFNLRRGIRTDAHGRYQFRSIVPVGYSVPPGGSTEQLLSRLGRHGSRPAHIHFFVSAQGFRKLTTQINIEGDPLLWDDFAFATRDGLVPPVTHVSDVAEQKRRDIDRSFASIDFDFVLHEDQAGVPEAEIERRRATA